MILVVEYLVLLPQDDSFCDSVEGFRRLLEADSTIKLKKNEVHHISKNKEFIADHNVRIGQVGGKGRYYHLTFTWTGSDESKVEEVEQFSALLRTIRKVVSTLRGQVETLRDDVSMYYARRAYPLIHETENLLRQLITQFMLTTIGREWVKETSPNEFKNALDTSKRKDKDYLNVLHTVDFITLGDFLFRPYSMKTKEELYEKLKGAKDEDLPELKTYIPLSNWKRYFAGLVDCDDSYLDSRWRELYELRCKVAHNALLTRDDHDKIALLIDEVKPKFNDAIRKLNQVNVPANEVAAVAKRDPISIETQAISVGRRTPAISVAMRQLLLQAALSSFAENTIGVSISTPFRERLNLLMQKGVITAELQEELEKIYTDLKVAHSAARRKNPISAELIEKAKELTSTINKMNPNPPKSLIRFVKALK